jgi:hypothetical protein
MLTEQEILSTIDNSNNGGYYCHFVNLGDVYSYLIDCRLNVFHSDYDNWAVAIERLGYNPRSDNTLLEIYYYGNCLLNLEEYNRQFTNYYIVYPANWDNFQEPIYAERSIPDAQYLLVRGEKIKLSSKKQDYVEAGIELKEYEPNEITKEEIVRLIITKHRQLFRATDGELFKSIPSDLNKILVLDEWYHKDYTEMKQPAITDDQLKNTYELNYKIARQEGLKEMDFETFSILFKEQEKKNIEINKRKWNENRPSSYETWQQLSKVIVTGDLKHYRPLLKPNTH